MLLGFYGKGWEVVLGGEVYCQAGLAEEAAHYGVELGWAGETLFCLNQYLHIEPFLQMLTMENGPSDSSLKS